jgi:cytochrome c oxidase assembly protein subunit 15
MLVVLALALSPVWQKISRSAVINHSRSLARAAIVITVIIYVQLALGATMRHQHRDLSITDFPLAYGQIIPNTSPTAIAHINAARDRVALSDVTAGQIWLQMAHRFGALIIGFSILGFWLFVRRNAFAIAPLRKVSTFWLVLVIVQIALGGWTILSNKAADIATAHVAVGAVTFVTGVALAALALRLENRPRVSAQMSAELAEAKTV